MMHSLPATMMEAMSDATRPRLDPLMVRSVSPATWPEVGQNCEIKHTNKIINHDDDHCTCKAKIIIIIVLYSANC